MARTADRKWKVLTDPPWNVEKGLCFFQAILVGNKVKTAQASFGQIRRAAEALILRCAASGTGESTGGIASNIGRPNLIHHL